MSRRAISDQSATQQNRASIRGLPWLTDHDKRPSVFGVGLFWMVVDHRQRGFPERLGVRQVWIGGGAQEEPLQNGSDSQIGRGADVLSGDKRPFFQIALVLQRAEY